MVGLENLGRGNWILLLARFKEFRSLGASLGAILTRRAQGIGRRIYTPTAIRNTLGGPDTQFLICHISYCHGGARAPMVPSNRGGQGAHGTQ